MIKSALYARVSSGRQENEETIQSQLSELRLRIQEDEVGACEEFTDESYSRDDLARPALDRLRDLVAEECLDRVYIQCPDRLASGAKLVLLVEEFQKHAVEVVFLIGAIEDTPEGKLYLHIHGAMAEYERTKIIERTRRGKMHWAKQGALMGGFVPYGYRYVPRDREGNRRATLEVDELQSTVVRDIFKWLVEEQHSCRSIARRLTELGIVTQKGKDHWTPSVVNRMLKQEVYKGTFYYHRAEAVAPTYRINHDRYAKSKLTGRRIRPREEWITIPVPAILDDATWEAAQRQLHQNFLHSPRNNTRHKYLLRSLIRCHKCGSTYVGAVSHGRRKYHCNQFDPLATSSGEKCRSPWIGADEVEEAVWSAVAEALRQPAALIEEYERRLKQSKNAGDMEPEKKQVEVALRRLKNQQNRITDAYVNEAMELPDYKTQMDKTRDRKRQLEGQLIALNQREERSRHDQESLRRIESFCETISQGLEQLNFEEKQSVLRLVVERVAVDGNQVRVEAIIPLDEKPGDLVRLRPQGGHPGVDRDPHQAVGPSKTILEGAFPTRLSSTSTPSSDDGVWPSRASRESTTPRTKAGSLMKPRKCRPSLGQARDRDTFPRLLVLNLTFRTAPQTGQHTVDMSLMINPRVV